MSERYHIYTKEEIEGTEEFNPQKGTRFGVYVRSAAYRSGCGGEGEGVFWFDTMLGALCSLSDEWDDVARRELSAERYEAWKAGIDAEIKTIETERSDEEASLCPLGFQGNCAYYEIDHYGYWEDFVREHLWFMESELCEEMWGEDEDEAEESEAGDSEDEGDPEGLATLLKRVRALMDRSDIDTKEFEDEFENVCADFEYWKC